MLKSTRLRWEVLSTGLRVSAGRFSLQVDESPLGGSLYRSTSLRWEVLSTGAAVSRDSIDEIDTLFSELPESLTTSASSLEVARRRWKHRTSTSY